MIVHSTDLVNYGFGESGIDYFTAKAPEGTEAIITNPPFNLSEQFIRKAVTEAPIVAMLVKSQYWHAKARLKLFAECPPKYVLPLTWRPDFLFTKGNSPVMEVLWTVWDNTHTGSCIYQPLAKSI